MEPDRGPNRPALLHICSIKATHVVENSSLYSLSSCSGIASKSAKEMPHFSLLIIMLGKSKPWLHGMWCICKMSMFETNTGIKSLNCTNQVNVRCCKATAVYHSAKVLVQCFIPHVWCISWLETCPHCYDCCNLLTFPSQILLSTKGAPLLCNGFLGCNQVNCLLFTVLPINTPPFVYELTESLSNQENSKKPIKRVNALQLDTHWPDWSPVEEGLGSPPGV